MSAVPSFIRTFRRSFDRTMAEFAAAQRKRALAIDPRLASTIDLMLATLAGGKRLRALLVSIGYEAAGGKHPTTVLPAGLSVELIHSFALIHDDIIDRAVERRGIPTVEQTITKRTNDPHAGLTTALLSGDLLFSVADRFDRIKLPAPRREQARRAFSRMAEETVLGQQLEFDLSRQHTIRLEDIVKSMIYKSGRYSIEWPLTIGAILGGARPTFLKSLSSFSIPLGLGFQLRDDILGTFGDPKETGKSRDSDIREGKHTLLVHFALELATPKERGVIRRVLGNQHAPSRDVARVRALIRSTGALAQAEQLSRDLTDASLAAIRRSSMQPRARAKLESLARYLFGRNS